MATEYEQLIKNLTKRFAKQKSEAESGAIGEAIRRGGTGGSLEAGLRQSATQPVVEAESNTIAGLLAQQADKQREERLIGEGRQFQTAERLGSQEFSSSESDRARRENALNEAILEGFVRPGTTDIGNTAAWQGYTNPYDPSGQQFYGRTGARSRAGAENYGYNLALQDRKPKPRRRQWWEGAASGIAGGIGTGAGIAAGTALFSDKRTKKEIKDVGTLNLKEFKYKKPIAKKYGLPVGKQIGVIAQDVEKVMPEAVGKRDGYKTVDYSKLLGG